MVPVINEKCFLESFCRDHSRHKPRIAERLALSGLAVAYYEEVDYQGPFPALYNIDTDKHNIAVIYDQPIDVRNKSGFEVGCLWRMGPNLKN